MLQTDVSLMTSHSLWCHLEPQCHASYAPSWPRIRKHPWCQTPQYLQVFVINILVWQHPLAKRSTNLPFFCHSNCIKLSIVRDRYNNTKRLNRRRGNVEVFTYRYLCPTYYELERSLVWLVRGQARTDATVGNCRNIVAAMPAC